jgi:hypothetical protein
VFRLKQSGMTFDDIALTMRNDPTWGPLLPKSYTGNTALKDVRLEVSRHRTELAQVVEEVREEEIARLNRMLQAIWPLALGRPPDLRTGQPAQLPDLAAIGKVLEIMARRAKYIPGLDAPIKVAPTNPAGDQSYNPEGSATGPDPAFFAALGVLFQELGPLHLVSAVNEDGELELPPDAPTSNGTNGTVHP